MLEEQINIMHMTCITLNYKLQSFETAILQSTGLYGRTAKRTTCHTVVTDMKFVNLQNLP
jgi:hypothetical protein